MIPSRALRPAQETLQAPAKPLIVGRSSALLSICELAERVAAGDAKVLITGESGVGKDLIARLIHANSKRSAQPYIAVNCAGVPETLLESQLFGHVKGAFTDAIRDKAGLLQQAHRGTIFLDEVAEMSLRMQAMFLRFLENGEIQPVGSDVMKTQVDVRVIAATNVDLRQAVREGRFREDLFFRLNVFPIHLPPLRDRRDDIPLLMSHFLAHYNKRHQRQVAGFSQAAVKAMYNYGFPGNIRELQNCIERAFVLCGDGRIDIAHLPEELTVSGSSVSLGPQSSLHELLDRQAIQTALERSGFNRLAAARELGIHKTTLFRRMKRLGMALPDRDGRSGIKG